jgi:hypothetical protein
MRCTLRPREASPLASTAVGTASKTTTPRTTAVALYVASSWLSPVGSWTAAARGPPIAATSRLAASESAATTFKAAAGRRRCDTDCIGLFHCVTDTSPSGVTTV